MSCKVFQFGSNRFDLKTNKLVLFSAPFVKQKTQVCSIAKCEFCEVGKENSVDNDQLVS